jgi:ribonucleoside-diphosphate reductase alpha chain
VRSLPDGVAQVINDYLQQRAERLAQERISGSSNGNGEHIEINLTPETPLLGASLPAMPKIGDLCPECGEAALVNEELPQVLRLRL